MIAAEPVEKHSEFMVRVKNVTIRGVVLRPRDDYQFSAGSGTEIFSALPGEDHSKDGIEFMVDSNHRVTLPPNYRIKTIFVDDAPSSQNSQ